ncbi:MAG: hypothetical protein U9O20_03920 [Patescibacteria group bacterium]|nr:hypothetical protein [Patescibacteria group bacterium]
MTSILIKIRKKWQLIVYVSLILGAITFLVSTVISPKYKSEVSILIVQHNVDTYSVVRSAGYLGDIFSQVLYTESFLNDVLESPFEIERNFSNDPKKKRSEWKKEVAIKKIADTGIVQIKVFDVSRIQAEKISSGIAWNFAVNGTKYHGGADNIEVKIIDGPITSSKPAYPNVLMNTIFGLMAGLFGSLILIFFFDEFDLKVVESRRLPRSIVKDEIERQLQKRSRDERLEYLSTEPEVYEIKKVVSRVEPETEKNSVASEDIYESDKPVTAKKIEDEPVDQFSSEIEQKKEMVRVAIKEEKSKVELEKEEKIKKVDLKSNGNKRRNEKTSFLSRLYKKSLFADKLFSKNKHLIIEEYRHHQERLDDTGDESIERVKKITSLEEKNEEQLPWMGGVKKAPAPDDLPIFVELKEKTVQEETIQQEKENMSNDKKLVDEELAPFVGKKEHNEFVKEFEKEEQKKELMDSDMESTDDEVKDRLNKLLKGEL